jgi:hypothetical protein
MKNTISTLIIMFSFAACTAEFETGSDTANPFPQEEQKQPIKATGPADAKSLQCKGVQTVLNMDFSTADFANDNVESSLAILRKFDSLSVEMITLFNVSLVRINEDVQLEFVSDNTSQPTYKVELSTKDFVTATAKLIGLNSSEEMSCEFFQAQE